MRNRESERNRDTDIYIKREEKKRFSVKMFKKIPFYVKTAFEIKHMQIKDVLKLKDMLRNFT